MALLPQLLYISLLNRSLQSGSVRGRQRAKQHELLCSSVLESLLSLKSLAKQLLQLLLLAVALLLVVSASAVSTVAAATL
jgi:hypothetical protein